MEPGRKKTFSPVWEFFERIHPSKVKCLLCSKELAYSDNTSSMLRHFRALHEIKENSAGPSQGNKREELDQALVDMIVEGTLPINIVEDRGFRIFVDKLDPTYVLPTKQTLHAMMEMKYQRPDEAIKTEAVPMAETFFMEVCVDSVESAVNAERGGAGRLELCSSLLEGGLTPSLGLLQVVKQCVKIPVYVMIRPRGGDFLYSDQEVEVMKKDIELMKSHGADGLVLGALTEDGRVDVELCTELLAAARPLPVTFHRAFDMVLDPVVALEAVVTLGFERVLTSGCDISAMEGLPVIKRLIDKAKGRIIIMPGGGVTERNLQRILEGSGAQEFHCSARSSRESAMKFRNTSVKMSAGFAPPEFVLQVADVSKVHTLNAIARNTL